MTKRLETRNSIPHNQPSFAEFFISISGKHVTSPKSKLQQQKLKSFHEEKSPKTRMINAQSTESLESLSDELASNSGGNNSSNNSTNEVNSSRRGRVSWTIPT